MQPLVPRLLLQTRVTRTRSSQQDAESVLRNYPHSAHNLWNVTIWRSRALKGESPLRWQLCAAVGRCHRARCAMANTFWHVCLFDRILVRYPICCVPLNEADISYTSSYKCPTCVGISQYYCIKLTLCSLHLGIRVNLLQDGFLKPRDEFALMVASTLSFLWMGFRLYTLKKRSVVKTGFKERIFLSVSSFSLFW